MSKRLAIIDLHKDSAALPDIEQQIWQEGEQQFVSSLLHALPKLGSFQCFETTVIRGSKKIGSLRQIPQEFELINLNGNPLDLWRLWRWQKKQQFLHIISFGKESLSLALKISKMRQGKNCRILAAFPFLPPVPWKSMSRDFAAVDICLCGSAYIGRRIENSIKTLTGRNEPATPRTAIVAPGIDLDKWTHNHRQWDDTRRFVFGMCDSLLPASGALMTTRAMAAVWQQEDLPQWEMRMFGRGERFAEILAEADSLGVISRISILADQPLHEVVPLCDAWLAPGSADCELTGVAECGFAAGMPVICSRSELHLERIKGKNAADVLWVDCNNPQELAKAMIALMKDAGLRMDLAQASRDFRPFINIRKTAEEFCDIISRD